METKNYYTSITVNRAPSEVFDNINNVAAWWTDDLTGSTQKLKDEFTVHFGDIHHSTQQITELVPDKKVVWLVTDSRLNFIKEKDEWTNTTIVFSISTEGNITRLDFTHIGLVPAIECYKDCSKGWDYYINSLFKLLTEGKGTPGL